MRVCGPVGVSAAALALAQHGEYAIPVTDASLQRERRRRLLGRRMNEATAHQGGGGAARVPSGPYLPDPKPSQLR